MPLVFVVDDDPNISQLISEYLKKDGYDVNAFGSGADLIDTIRRKQPDCLVLDIMMPGINGFQLLTMIRGFSEMPIIMVSARGEEMDRIMGLELGCNDYLGKPFHPRELVCRVTSMIRLAGFRNSVKEETAKAPIRAGRLLISEDYRKVETQDGTELPLTFREYELLLHFAKNPNRPFSREQLIQQVWDYDFLGDLRVVDELVKRLRKKLGDSSSGFSIETVWGYGYKISVKL
ncbi:response regulator transcription factor [Paenibacillus sp. sptzw28]|uniref:response regulator transcription factor n=1 Tax=Paenibacillus sp. sptzw28 TaxID=715179 RepID=UPI001C6E76BE|nr:response regulator transcription factor [Paenibacillus sp. sptzw28]QYR20927.1 response regulator transcription factor [Paenibacillus sp. sptzw28]